MKRAIALIEAVCFSSQPVVFYLAATQKTWIASLSVYNLARLLFALFEAQGIYSCFLCPNARALKYLVDFRFFKDTAHGFV